MTRFITIIFLIGLFSFSCVKPKTENPVPVIEFEDLLHLQKSEFTGSDTAVMSLKYEDGDGDIFLDDNSNGPNVIFTPFFFNTATKKFDFTKDPITLDTLRITAFVKQPDDGYYKGKSIKGNIYVPMRQYRTGDSIKIIYLRGLVIDSKGNKSNTVTSPTYTLNF
ncbi:hypothetical protein [Aurantibacillus circumpalustris]|uniref:hypothetical protein n=1 Tax=Aurantibacillus circumpalustris TaxID=3036359 RepID=UPI00295B75FC|nr:hypothetical protein [Aurantibacillus circumpalustris]